MRAVGVVVVLGSALLAYAAVGNGDIVATQPITVVTVTSTTGSGSGTVSLQNTSAATTYSVLVGSDATCDPDVTFSITGGNPITGFQPSTSRNVQVGCPARGDEAMQHCLFHATNSVNQTPLADFMGVCLYGASPPTLLPLQTSLDLGTVTVGDFAEDTLTIRNNGTGAPIKRVYLMTSDLDGNFQLTTPCNPDGSYCDVELATAVAPGSTFDVGIKCRPQAAGTHTAQVYVGTDTFQLLSLGVTLQCSGAATTQPALTLNPTTIEIPTPVEVKDDEAVNVVVHVANEGAGTLLIRDVRTVDVDAGAADDWTYAASGDCSGQISSMCMLAAGKKVDINLTFDPSQIGSRRAALLISYRDTLDRTFEIPLGGVGRGATLRRPGPQGALAFGTVPVGTTSSLDITLVNDGNRDATIMPALAAATMPPFSTTPATGFVVSPGTPRTITVTCTPQAAGMFTTTVSLSSMDTLSAQPLTVSATCDGTTQALYANPTALPIGEVRINAGTLTRTVQVLSNSGSPLTFAGEPQLDAANAAITLGPLSQSTTPASFDVTLAPQLEGPMSATILVQTDDGQTVRIPVSATAVKAAYLAVETLDLGTFCVDQPTTSSNLPLFSSGTATIELLAPALGQSPSPFELSFTTPPVYPHRLAPTKAAIVSVTPKRQRAAMTVADSLTWRTDVEGGATAGTALTARFIDSGGAIAPPALTFGEVTVHLFTPNGQRVVIQNCNPTPLVLDPPNIRTPFSIDSPNFPAMLSPNESVAFSVGFHPTRVGTVMDVLRITSPQLPGSPLEVTLVGTGSAGEPAPDAGIGLTPPGDTSFYACSCNSSTRRRGPLGVIPIALAVLCTLFGRRRSGLP